MSVTFNAVMGEVRKELLITFSYRFALIFDVIGYAVIYLAAMFIVGQGDFVVDTLATTLIGFIITNFILETLNSMANDVQNEATEGTLEQMYMSAVSPLWLMVGKVIAVQIVSFVMMFLLGAVLLLIFSLPINLLHPLFLLILLLTLVGVVGFGFAIAAMALVYKQMGSFVSIIFNLILFLNGTFVPVEAMPFWMRWIGEIFPTTQGIQVARAVLIDGATFGGIIRDGSLPLLILHSGVYLVLGIVLYRFFEQQARRTGALGHY